MKPIDVIKDLCKKEKLSISALERELGYGNGSLAKAKKIPGDRIYEIAKRFNVTVEYIMAEDKKEVYYLNDETAKVAQEIFENKELRALFNVQRNMDPDDLRALHNMALALKRKEKGYIDDTGC